MKDWGVLLTLFAASVNVITAGVLWYFGHIGRRRDKMQQEITEMLYERIVALERTLGRVAENQQRPKHH